MAPHAYLNAAGSLKVGPSSKVKDENHHSPTRRRVGSPALLFPHDQSDSFLLVLERKRKPDEHDRFFWYREKCHAELYQAVRHVPNYRENPVSRVYEEFYSEESHRTCGKCGHVTPRPAS